MKLCSYYNYYCYYVEEGFILKGILLFFASQCEAQTFTLTEITLLYKCQLPLTMTSLAAAPVDMFSDHILKNSIYRAVGIISHLVQSEIMRDLLNTLFLYTAVSMSIALCFRP